MNFSLSRDFLFKSNYIIIFSGILTGVALLSLTSLDSKASFLVLPLLFMLFYLTVRFPEILFAFFLAAGVYKADPRLSFLPGIFDLTVLFGMFTLISIFYKLISGQAKIIIPSKKVLIPIFLIILMGTISLTYTLAPIYGTEKLLRFITITSFSLFAPFILFQDNKAIKRFFVFFILLGLVMILDVISGGLTPGKFEFQSAFGSNYLAMGRIVGIASVIVLFYFLMAAQTKLLKLFYFSLIPVFQFGIFISGGKGPLIALFVSISAVFIYLLVINFRKILPQSSSTNNKKVELKMLLIFFLFIISSAIVVVNFSEYFSTIFLRLHVGDTGDRLSMFKSAADVIFSLPSGLIGLGIGGFSFFYAGIDAVRGTYPHNIFLEVGSELGIVGLIAIVLLIYWTFHSLLSSISKEQGNRQLNITLLALFIIMLVNSSVSGDINDNRLLFTVIGLIFTFNKVTYKAKDEEKN